MQEGQIGITGYDPVILINMDEIKSNVQLEELKELEPHILNSNENASRFTCRIGLGCNMLVQMLFIYEIGLFISLISLMYMPWIRGNILLYISNDQGSIDVLTVDVWASPYALCEYTEMNSNDSGDYSFAKAMCVEKSWSDWSYLEYNSESQCYGMHMFIPSLISWMVFYTCIALVFNFILIIATWNSSSEFTNPFHKITFRLILMIVTLVTITTLYYTITWTGACQFELNTGLQRVAPL